MQMRVEVGTSSVVLVVRESEHGSILNWQLKLQLWSENSPDIELNSLARRRRPDEAFQSAFINSRCAAASVLIGTSPVQSSSVAR